jgi:hypothetical protein
MVKKFGWIVSRLINFIKRMKISFKESILFHLQLRPRSVLELDWLTVKDVPVSLIYNTFT